MHPNLPYGGPGLVARGSFLLRELTCEAYALTNATVTNKIKFRRALADAEAPGFSITNAIDGNTEKGGWTASTFPVVRQPGTPRRVRVRRAHGGLCRRHAAQVHRLSKAQQRRRP